MFTDCKALKGGQGTSYATYINRQGARVAGLTVNGSKATGYFTANKFISMFGDPFFGSISTKNPGLLYQNPSTLYFSFEYSHTFAPGYSLGASFDIYQQMPCGANDINQKTVHDIKAATSFAAGVYLRINPSFILKSFTR